MALKTVKFKILKKPVKSEIISKTPKYRLQQQAVQLSKISLTQLLSKTFTVNQFDSSSQHSQPQVCFYHAVAL
jgi:hypothetical protein